MHGGFSTQFSMHGCTLQWLASYVAELPTILDSFFYQYTSVYMGVVVGQAWRRAMTVAS